jgi:type I restriction enzyme M protein
MAIKKSELYSKLWASCDALRGRMDPSMYKDYVLVILFLKYVSDKYAGDKNALIEIPKGGSFADIAKLKGTKDIGERINTAIGALAEANDLVGVIDVVSFADEEKLGKGKEMIDTLSELISIFEDPALDFSKNKAEGDDLLGDAFEYMMRHFATESGKSKGQFYTPAEVSRIMAKVMNVKSNSNKTTFYDPTCGSGSLLLKVVEEADGKGTLYGQEMDVATAALSKMNLILHGFPETVIARGQSTLSHPQFLGKNGELMTFDYISANFPFSLSNWATGFNPYDDAYGRFDGFGIPPDKNGDYAFMLHIVKSLKSTGKGAVILPHGVLFRGNAESEIRKNLIKQCLIKGVIGLPANLFYGTGIPAAIIIIDKEHAAEQIALPEQKRGIFMIDASKGFIKDGNKNRIREQDIHKIVDVFNKQLQVPKFSRFVPYTEITDAKNDFNLNIPRYIDTQEAEDIQDISSHLMGDIPGSDIEALGAYWKVYPSFKSVLFKDSKRKGYYQNIVDKDKVKETIFHHPEFTSFSKKMDKVFTGWRSKTGDELKFLKKGYKPKLVIAEIAEQLLSTYDDISLIDKYDIYQYLMNYWTETMQDDMYIVALDGWKAEPYRVLIKDKKGKEVDKGWTCDLIPPSFIVNTYFSAESEQIEKMEAEKESLYGQLEEMEETHGGEEGFFSQLDKVNKANVAKRIKELKGDKTAKDEVKVLQDYIDIAEQVATLNGQIKAASEQLDKLAYNRYKKLSEQDIKDLVVEGKWMTAIEQSVKSEMERISQRLTQRVKELIERYESPLPEINKELAELEKKVTAHLAKMGYSIA